MATSLMRAGTYTHESLAGLVSAAEGLWTVQDAADVPGLSPTDEAVNAVAEEMQSHA